MLEMIIGLTLKTIDAKRTAQPKGQIRVDTNTKINSVGEMTIPWVKEKVNKIDFTFTVKYLQEKKEVGSIVLGGEVMYQGRADEIKKTWKKKKALPEDIGVQVVNAVLRKCLTRAIGLAEDVALPPPVGLPMVRKKAQTPGYIG